MEKIKQVCWECPSNIALIKYWGKRPVQFPMNPSFSFSLQNSRTRTSVQLEEGEEGFHFLFEGKETGFSERTGSFLRTIVSSCSWLRGYHLTIESENTFPHSAGIASSASAFGALALCLVDLGKEIEGGPLSEAAFFRAASGLARQGSGSACRSIYPGFAWWGESGIFEGSCDEYAVPVTQFIDPLFYSLCDAVLMVDSSSKEVSSSAGHQLMDRHFFREGRMRQAGDHLSGIMAAMRSGDYGRFFAISESEALSLHALMMTSDPSFLLLKPASISLLNKIKEFRRQSGLSVGFSIDAGPNIHFLYFEKDKEEVHRFIVKVMNIQI